MTDRDTPPLTIESFTVQRDALVPAIICAALALAIVVALFAIIARSGTCC